MPRPSLGELQEWMRWAITDPRGVSTALAESRPAGLGRRYQAPTTDARMAISARTPRERETRMGIYAEAYFHRLLASLEEDFPATVRLLGQEDFARLINDYLKEYPSRSFTLADAGENLARFTARSRPEEPWLSQLLDLEWRMLETFYAPRASPLSPERVEGLKADADWANAKLVFVPGLFLLESQWPVASFRLNLISRAEFLSAAAKTRWLLISRDPSGVVQLEGLSQTEAACLAALMNGQPLEAALSLATEASSDSDLNETLIGEWFARWMRLGWLQQIIFPDSPHGAPDA